jgi:hypothetical protein
VGVSTLAWQEAMTSDTSKLLLPIALFRVVFHVVWSSFELPIAAFKAKWPQYSVESSQLLKPQPPVLQPWGAFSVQVFKVWLVGDAKPFQSFDWRCTGYEAIGYTIKLPGNAVPGVTRGDPASS